jgi:4,5-DOPA dioxygenase extradiol
MNAIEDGEFPRGWAQAARRVGRPERILCVSAHWETRDGVSVTAAERPRTIHDFSGFPAALGAVRYDAPGDPDLAREIAAMVTTEAVRVDPRRGLDHGAWGVLRPMFPEADVPVVQLSLDTSRPPSFHQAIARELAPLRQKGVLVVGSGNIVHNLALLDLHRADGYDWAVRFDRAIAERVESGDPAAVAGYEDLGRDARLSVPTPEHFLPLLYVLGMREPGETVEFFNEEVLAGSISMRSLIVGT